MPTQQIFASNFHFHSTMWCLFVWNACRVSNKSRWNGFMHRISTQFDRFISVLQLHFWSSAHLSLDCSNFHLCCYLCVRMFDWKAKKSKIHIINSPAWCFYCPCVDLFGSRVKITNLLLLKLADWTLLNTVHNQYILKCQFWIISSSPIYAINFKAI